MNLSSGELKKLSESAAFSPKEQLQALEEKEETIFFGVPKEKSFQERRVALTPDGVALLVAHGHRVMIEKGAGEGSNFDDNEYIQAGAQIQEDVTKVYRANILLKIAPPSFQEIEMMLKFINNEETQKATIYFSKMTED